MSNSLFTGPEQVHSITERIEALKYDGKLDQASRIENCSQLIDTVRIQFVSGQGKLFDPGQGDNLLQMWPMIFCRIGKLTLSILNDNNAYSHDTFARMLIDKHKRYGAKPILRWSALGLIIRIDSKWERFLNLLQNPQISDGGENRIDTLRDILGYCVLGVALMEFVPTLEN